MESTTSARPQGRSGDSWRFLQGVILLVLMVVTLAALSAACASPRGESSIRATVATSLPPGVYTLQASLDSHLPGCFWGNTLDDVHLPQTSLNIAVSQICSGS